MTLQLYNTLTKQIESFKAQDAPQVKLYTCGPTVYDYLHIGNWAAYIYWDTLVRVLRANDFEPERVMNITDVGHLTSDEDEGEDKLQKGARRENKTAWDVAKFYGDDFLEGMSRLYLLKPDHITKATDYIEQQLELIRTLKEKDFTYQINDGIYFDTSKFPSYGDFAHLNTEALKAGARVEYNPQKRSASDFALWKFSPTGEKRDMEWETPADILSISQESNTTTKSNETSATRVSAGAYPTETRSEAVEMDLGSSVTTPIYGFPGWHLECSAMAMAILGDTLDIHTGGIDHIPVHHTNEIAQSEAASGKRFSNYWLHNNHITVDGTKVSKSLGNGHTLDDIEEQGFSPLDYKLFVLQSHYRSESNFTYDNLEAAQNRRLNWRNIAALRHQIHSTIDKPEYSENNTPPYTASRALVEIISHDLNTPEALQFIDETFNDIASSSLERIHRSSLVSFLETIDELLGLSLIDSSPDISEEAKQLVIERERVREQKNWSRSDEIRDQLLSEEGITLRDTDSGTVWAYTQD
jgi:cysteinyl-tRNA synthetase